MNQAGYKAYDSTECLATYIKPDSKLYYKLILETESKDSSIMGNFIIKLWMDGNIISTYNYENFIKEGVYE